MFFLLRLAVGLAAPIVKGAVVALVIGLAVSMAGVDPIAVVEPYLTDWLWSQI